MFDFILSHFYWFWIGVLLLSLLIEAATFALTTVWAAVSALLMVFLSFTKVSINLQMILFLVLTICLIVFTRPFAIKKLKVGKTSTNVDSMVGQEVLIEKKVSPFSKGAGKTKNGVIWTCVSESGEEIECGEVCVISGVDGNTLKVKRK